MASELRVDKIIPVNGVPTGGSGGIIQVAHGKLSDTFAADGVVGNNYWVNVGLAATITPLYSTSNIMIMVNMYIGKDQDNSSYQQQYRIIKDGSTVAALYGNPGSTHGVTGRINGYNNNTPATGSNVMNQYSMNMLGGIHIESNVGTTNAVTYRVDLRGYTSSPGVYVNRQNTYQTSSTNYDGVPQSTITLMELST
tara:strand:- start:2573 stop:3160 length:588 start_codon:yes stop_codon:yes gene_type:complete